MLSLLRACGVVEREETCEKRRIVTYTVLQVPVWMNELRTKGWAVVPEAIAKEKALGYADEGYKWLESWGLGYKRSDPSTRKSSNLPWHIRGGLYAR